MQVLTDEFTEAVNGKKQTSNETGKTSILTNGFI